MSQDPTTYVGLDVHKDTIQVAVLFPSRPEVVEWTEAHNAESIRRFARRLLREAPESVECCYEAGPTGYYLQRKLRSLGVGCTVVAPSLIPIKPGARIKTDRKDARKLAEFFRGNLLTEVHPPSETDEAFRDLVLGLPVDHAADQEPYRQPVAWLRCFRGIDTLTAACIVAELHDFRRFPNPRSLMAYLGLVPSEHSSGSRESRGSITKTGNTHIRRLLVEAAWHHRHKPRVTGPILRRRLGQPARVLALADRAQERLYAGSRRMTERGVVQPKVIVAMARERVGYLWATLHPEAQPIRPGPTPQEQAGGSLSQNPHPLEIVAPTRSERAAFQGKEVSGPSEPENNQKVLKGQARQRFEGRDEGRHDLEKAQVRYAVRRRLPNPRN